jgi:anti-sigma regulatory factor (Ser/Thr protein kinase)
MPESFGATYPAVPGAVGEARRELAAFAARAGASGRTLDAIQLAVGEALANVAMHAYPGGAGRMNVEAALAARELWVLVSDEGTGLRAGAQSEGLGQGLLLIAQAADGLTIVDRSGGGTEVRMRFDLEPPQSRGSVSSASLPASSRFSTTK